MGKQRFVTYHSDVETTSFFMTQIEETLRAEGYEVFPLHYNALPEFLYTNVVVHEDDDDDDDESGSGKSSDTNNAAPNLTVNETDGWLTDTADGKGFAIESQDGQKTGAGDSEAALTKEKACELWQEAVFLTFNFAGIYSKDGCFLKREQETAETAADLSEKKQGRLLVDALAMQCVNIIVDHPYHYHDFLYEQIRFRSSRYLQFCIDKQHIAYMKEYFPEITLGEFLPSGGTGWRGECKAWEDRPIDILFPATYVAPDSFDVFIERNGPEYSEFYHSILDEVLADPNAKLEDVVRRRMEEEIEEGFTWEELRLTLGHIQFLDYYIRYKRRAEVVRMLVDGDPEHPLHLTILGSGWEEFVKTLRHPERVTLLPYADSEEVLRLMTDSKVVLNVLPSFHEGAHDRIFNAMLCGAVCASDSNIYLDTILTDKENAILYRTAAGSGIKNAGPFAANGKDLCENLWQILQPEQMPLAKKIAENGRSLAKENTWAERAQRIIRTLKREEII